MPISVRLRTVSSAMESGLFATSTGVPGGSAMTFSSRSPLTRRCVQMISLSGNRARAAGSAKMLATTALGVCVSVCRVAEDSGMISRYPCRNCSSRFWRKARLNSFSVKTTRV